MPFPSHISASQIETFDETTPFGCNRKWYFERILEKDRGFMSGTDTGTAVHDTLEAFLKGEPQGVLHEIVVNAPGAVDWLIKLRPRVTMIEREIGTGKLFLAGVPTVGFIDWVAKHSPLGYADLELGDHKTSSNIARYGKTPGQIKSSIQMNIYAYALDKVFGENVDHLAMTQDFYQTGKSRKFLPVSCTTTKREIRERILEIEATVEKMVRVSNLRTPEEVEPNLKACDIARGCPHRGYCPRAGAFNMASLMDAFFPSATPEVIESAKAVVAAQQVLPPDAPKSNPAAVELPPSKAIAQAEKEEAATLEARKLGRPKGSQNKPKELGTSCAALNTTESVVVQVSKIYVHHSVKIGKANFSSAGVEVGMEGIIPPGGSLQAAKESLSMQVRQMVIDELKVYESVK